MGSVVAAVKSQVDQACLLVDKKQLKSGECYLLITGAPKPHLVINFDKPESPLGANDEKPDFLFLSDKGGKDKKGQGGLGLLVPIELSAGRSKSAQHIKNQLQAGVDWSQKVIPEQSQLQLIPIYCGPIDNLEKAEIKKAQFRVVFRGQKETALLRRCGSKLTDALKAAS